MSTADKLNKLLETKEAIRQSIIAKGTDVGTDVPFSQYPNKIDEIQTGSGGGSSFAEEFYNMKTGASQWNHLFANINADMDLQLIDTRHVTSVNSLFFNTFGSFNCSNWNLICVTDAQNMFNSSHANFDFSNVTNTHNMMYLQYMFSYFCGNIDISNFRFCDDCYFDSFFSYANLSGIAGLENFSVPSRTISMSSMFTGVHGVDVLDLSTWNVPSTVTSFNSCFAYIPSIKKIDLTGWNFNTENYVNAGYMFAGSYTTTEILIPDLDLTGVDCYAMFEGCTALEELRLDNCNTTTIAKIINETNLPTDPLESANNRKIYCKEENATGLVAPANWEFVFVADEPEIPEEPDTGFTLQFKSNDPSGTFIVNGNSVTVSDCELTEDVYTYRTDEIVTELRMDGSGITNLINISDTSNIVDCRILNNCWSLAEANVANWDVSKMTKMTGMFTNCKFAELNGLNNWNVNHTTEMNSMFSECTILASLDLSQWNVSNVTDMRSMFAVWDASLTTLNIASWEFNDSVDITEIFYRQFNLSTITCNSYKTINKLIPELPDRTDKEQGIIYSSASRNMVDMEALNAKNWTLG